MKLNDTDDTRKLLDRLKMIELKKLAQRNNIALQKENSIGEAKSVKSKGEIIDILGDSYFKESDLVELLGVSRLTKEELLNQMNLRQLKGLARESGVLLEKTSFFRTKKATKKEDITDLLRVLNTPKVRNYAGKVKLIKKPTKIRVKKVKAVKAYAMKKTRSTENLKKETESIEKKRKKGRVTDARTSDVFLARKEPIFRKEDQEDVNVYTPRGTKGDEMVEEAIRERIIEREIVRRRIISRVRLRFPESK
jgi:hypothetical protein